MENLIIADIAESEKKEAVKLVQKIGYSVDIGDIGLSDHNSLFAYSDTSARFWRSADISYTDADFIKNHKKLTMPELRQLAGKESLNNTYAEIEQVRKAIKVESGADSNHTADAASYALFGFKQPDPLPFIDDEPQNATESRTSNENSTAHTNPQQDANNATNANAWQIQVGGDHYKKLKIQPMEYALANKLDYAQANVVKYVTRHADKNGKEDLLKAIHNIQLMIEHYYAD